MEFAFLIFFLLLSLLFPFFSLFLIPSDSGSRVAQEPSAIKPHSSSLQSSTHEAIALIAVIIARCTAYMGPFHRVPLLYSFSDGLDPWGQRRTLDGF